MHFPHFSRGWSKWFLLSLRKDHPLSWLAFLSMALGLIVSVLLLTTPSRVDLYLHDAKDGWVVAGGLWVLTGTIWIACGVILSNEAKRELTSRATKSGVGAPMSMEDRMDAAESVLSKLSAAASEASHNVWVGVLYVTVGTLMSLVPLAKENTPVGTYLFPAKPASAPAHARREKE